jgi:hypothetical protein
MAYEYPTARGVLRLLRIRRTWAIEYDGARRGPWPSADAAATAVAHHRTGLTKWDHRQDEVPADLLEWRPTGDSL